MKLKWKFIAFTAGLICFSSFAYAETFLTIAGSTYYRHGHDGATHPIIALGSNQGESWTYPEIKNPPADFSSGKFFTSTCQKNLCVAIGSYLSKPGQTFGAPLLATSQDSGASWSYVPALDDSEIVDYESAGTSCNSSFCAINLNKIDEKKSYSYPSIEIWNEKENAWSIANIESPKDSTTMKLADVSCSENVCATVGFYITKEPPIVPNVVPLILTTTDQGLHWTPASVKLPEGNLNISLTKVQCFENTCIAIGINRQFHEPLDIVTPVIITTQDKGATWNFIPQSELPKLVSEAHLFDIKCFKDRCIAVGYNSDKTKPILMFVSKDQGKTWFSPPTINSKLPAKLREGAELFSIDCNDNLCTVAGTSGYGEDRVSILAKSLDKGDTWSFIPEGSYVPTSIANYTYCDKNDCMFTNATYNDSWVLISHDNGSDWTFPSMNLPKDYEGVEFLGRPSSTA